MTSHVARLALAASILGLFLAWAGIAAAPWPAKTPAAAQDPVPAALAAYEQRLRRDARLVSRIPARRAEQPPSAPSVRIVSRTAGRDDEDLVNRHAFGAMGTEIEFHLDSGPADETLQAAEDEFHRLEGLLSRFLPDSQLSRLNAEGTLAAGPDLLAVVDAALEGARSDLGTLRSNGSRRAGRGGLRPHVRAVSAGTSAPSPPTCPVAAPWPSTGRPPPSRWRPASSSISAALPRAMR